MSNSMSSTSSDESYSPPQNSRFKRYSKVKSGKHFPNKSYSASSSFDASLPSCSGYLAGPSSKAITVSSSESDSDSSFSGTIPSSSGNCQNNNQIISYPASLGIKSKVVTPSERQKRWQIVADENKDLLDKIKISHYNSLKNSPLLTEFRKRKSDPEFRRSLNRPSKAIKIFSDEEEDNKPSSSSNGFPFTKEYDDYFRNLKLCESDEELSKYLKDTKTKGRLKSSYKGGPLADEYLLPIDYKKLFESDSEYDTGVKEKKQKSPDKVKSLGKKSKSLVNKKPCTKKPKSTPMKHPTKQPKSGKRNLHLPSMKLFDDNLNESHDDSCLNDYSVNDKTIPNNSVSADHALASQIACSDEEFNDTRIKLSSDELSHCHRFSKSTIGVKKETSKRTCAKKFKSSAKIPSLVIRQKSTAKKQSSGKKYRSRGRKSTHECKKADSLSSKVISQSNFFSESISMKEKIQVDIGVSSKYTMLVPQNESINTDSGHSIEGTKNRNRALNYKKVSFLTLEAEDRCLKVRLPQLPIGGLSSASDNKVECVIIKDADKNLDVNTRKNKIRLLSHEYIINDKIPRVSLMKISFKLPYINVLSR